MDRRHAQKFSFRPLAEVHSKQVILFQHTCFHPTYDQPVWATTDDSEHD
jgi:hypothetical protein